MRKSLSSKITSPVYYRYLTFCFTVALIAIVSLLQAQNPVKGRITSEEDESPIPGVNIIVKGTTEGTISDADGNFSVNVPAKDAMLIFSFVGYSTQEVAIEGRSTLSITLTTDARKL